MIDLGAPLALWTVRRCLFLLEMGMTAARKLTLPPAASLGLTFYNVTIGIPLSIEIVHLVGPWFQGT